MTDAKPFEYQESTGAVRHLRKAWGPPRPGPGSPESYPATTVDLIAALLAAPAEQRLAILHQELDDAWESSAKEKAAREAAEQRITEYKASEGDFREKLRAAEQRATEFECAYTRHGQQDRPLATPHSKVSTGQRSL